MALIDPARFLHNLFMAAVEAADPAVCVPPNLPALPAGRTVVVGAGKASAAMAQAAEKALDTPLSGLVVTQYGYSAPCRDIEIIEAGHPIPDEAGADASRRIVDLARDLGPDDLFLCLISGGGSALLSLPAPGVSLADKQAVTESLLLSGASIHEINCVRKHLSGIKGGQLAAAAAPARVVTLAISDVPGDDPSTIASGPTVADATTYADARAVLSNYGIEAPPGVRRHLVEEPSETPKPGDPRLQNDSTTVIADPARSLEAAAALAKKSGVTPLILGDAIEGESREVAKVFAGIATSILSKEYSVEPPAVILSGGETTVTVRGSGSGGPNAEFLLALAIALRDQERVWALACDTDGIDGSGDNAGAIIGPDTMEFAASARLDPQAMLRDNDSYGFFRGVDGLVMTGPTRTNVGDFRAILVGAD